MSNHRYIIVHASSIPALMDAVSPKLADGVWRCTGGPFYDDANRYYCQAIERPEREPAAPRGREVKLKGM